MASWISSKTSSFVSPTATQPGKSGTCAPKLLSPRSTTTAYFILLLLLQSSLLQNAVQCSARHVDAFFSRYSNRAGFVEMFELTMTAPGRYQIPIVFLKQPDDILHLHGLDNK